MVMITLYLKQKKRHRCTEERRRGWDVLRRQQSFKRNLLKKKCLTLVVCFLLLLKRERDNLTLAAYFLHLGTPNLPTCYSLGWKVGKAMHRSNTRLMPSLLRTN